MGFNHTKSGIWDPRLPTPDGHMKIDEPDTPFERADNHNENVPLDQSDLTSRLLDQKPPKVLQKQLESEFDKKRNDHYNMKDAMQRAKRLIEEDS